MNFFNKFPIINYAGHSVTNILARVKIADSVRNNKLVYYPYTYKQDDRADIISQHYYDDPAYLWLVWMSNNTIDPYYGVPLTEDEFQNHLTSKYGNVYNAQSTIKFYRNNWYSNQDRISIDTFSVLPSNYKKYYDPIVNSDFQVIAYIRKKYDDIVTTNRIVQITLTSNISVAKNTRIAIDSNNYGYAAQDTNSSILLIFLSSMLSGLVSMHKATHLCFAFSFNFLDCSKFSESLPFKAS